MISFTPVSFQFSASLYGDFNFILNNMTSKKVLILMISDHMLRARVSKNKPHHCGQNTRFISISERSGCCNCQATWQETNLEMTNEYFQWGGNLRLHERERHYRKPLRMEANEVNHYQNYTV